jgi:PEP-CTERM motif
MPNLAFSNQGFIAMHKLTFATLAAVVALALPAHAATEVTVDNIGAVLNESLALPAQDTPGSGIGFQEFFEFTLPTTETVTLSVSDSAIGAQRITGGLLSLNTFTSTAPVSPFQPIGALIESASILNVLGGQEGTVAPDVLTAGAYFALVEGTSGSSPIHIAIDGTVTAVATPEPSTWAMLAIGFGLMGFVGRRSRGHRLNLA